MGQQGLNDFKYPQLTKFDNFDNNIPSGSTGATGNNTNNDTIKQLQQPGQFDLQKFNKAFEQNKVQTSQINSSLESQRLAKLNSLAPPLKPYQLSFSELLVGIKDSWFELIDELLQSQFYIETFTKKNRMFYIGLTIVIIVIIIYLYDVIIGSIDDIEPLVTEKKVIEHHYYYHNSEPEISPNYEPKSEPKIRTKSMTESQISEIN